MKRKIAGIAAASIALAGGPALAQSRDAVTANVPEAAASEAVDGQPLTETPTGPADIVVFGRGESKIGIAHAASEGSVSGADLLVRPLLRVAELVEAVPGMIAAQHSGSGKANQYFLRGFNLDHGSDFTTYIDGVQMNLRTHGHGQGYLDLNGLIPEIVQREDYRKGPYRADGGDFALAGAVYMHTIDRYDRPWISAELGSFGWRRVAAGGTVTGIDGGDLTMVGQAKLYDGPWQQPEMLRHYAGFLKYTRPLGSDRIALTIHGYHASWDPTEQIPERAIGTALCPDAFCSPDPSARGMTTRVIGDLALEGANYRVNVYGQYYNWWMYSNPTYANPDGSSAQIKQFDRRFVAGLTGERQWQLGRNLELSVGTEERIDQIAKVGVYHTDDRVLVESLGSYRVTEASGAAYAEASWEPVAGARLIGGLRGDYYHYSVRPNDAAAAALGQGSGGTGLISPKVAIAYKIRANLEVYANWGRGFHSNDVRGAVTATPVPVLAHGTGKEAGIRYQRGGLTLTATYWWLDLGSELRFVGDSNSVEPTGASRRRGVEFVAFWRPARWLALDANFTASNARYDNGDRIANAFENAASAGVSAVTGRWEASLRLRHLGPYPLLEDNSQRDPGSNVVNARAAYTLGRAQLYAELLNV
ncbi:MAG: TonB-dependent receptor, partial [Sphingomonas bacterium]|nr:TonB-dependent receptor [Sphingomonas bacterium]